VKIKVYFDNVLPCQRQERRIQDSMILIEEKNIEWAPQPNKVRLTLTGEEPEAGLCSSAYVLAFEGDKILMADLDRGVDIPGGHIDPGETPEQAMRRETQEETGAIIGQAQLLGLQQVTLLGDKPVGYAYPYPTSYQLMYFTRDFQMGVFTEDEDSNGPVFIERAHAETIPWIQKNLALYRHALEMAQS